MNQVKIIMFFFLFTWSFSYSQDSLIQLPDFKKTKFTKKMTTNLLMAKMIDDLGYKYYKATDSLLSKETSHTFHSRNLPRLLLHVIYQMSDAIASSTTNHKQENGNSIEEMSFEELRKYTLQNLITARNHLIENSRTQTSFNINSLSISTSIADIYCDKILSYREYIGNQLVTEINSNLKSVPESVKFERNLGGDGLTTEQWIELSRYGPHRNLYFENIKRQSRRNMRYINELRKQEKVGIKVGNAKPIELSQNIVEGYTYTYFRNQPNRVSFLYSYDEELIKNLVNWITYINSGNPSKLDEIFSMGYGIVFNIDKNNNGQLSFNNVNFREIIDQDENKVRLEYDEEYFDGTNFSDITINEIHVNNTDQIEFLAQGLAGDQGNKTSQPAILVLKNIEGTLLKRIKEIIAYIRNDENRYNGDRLNLKKY